jgi:hypothetical protein
MNSNLMALISCGAWDYDAGLIAICDNPKRTTLLLRIMDLISSKEYIQHEKNT